MEFHAVSRKYVNIWIEGNLVIKTISKLRSPLSNSNFRKKKNQIVGIIEFNAIAIKCKKIDRVNQEL